MKLIPELMPLLKRTPPLKSESVWSPEFQKLINDSNYPAVVRAGLHLWNDDLDQCHSLVQENSSPEAKFWHALLHRREGDFSNSKYWFRDLGSHPVFAKIRAQVPEYEPLSFVDICAHAANDERPRLEEIQKMEMTQLLEHSSQR